MTDSKNPPPGTTEGFTVNLAGDGATLTRGNLASQQWHAFDLSPLDELSGDLSILKSLIGTSLDTPNPGDAENLLHAALHALERADARHQSVHQALMTLQREGR